MLRFEISPGSIFFKTSSIVIFLLFIWGAAEQGWFSGGSTRLTPMRPRLDSWSQCHMCVEFVVGSLLAPRGVSPGSAVFPSPEKPTLPNSNSIRNAWTCVEQAPECS